MNTPSKEALEAAKEFRSTVVGLSNDSTDKLAAIDSAREKEAQT